MNVTAETALLGMCLRSPKNLALALDSALNWQSFADPLHQRIWLEMEILARQGKDEDLLLNLGMLLREQVAYLAQLEIDAPVADDVAYYIAEVKEADFCRRAAERLSQLASMALAREPFSPAPVRQRMLEALAEAELDPEQRLGPRESPAVIQDVTLEVEENIKAPNEGRLRGWKTGFQTLDRMVMGLRSGWFYVLAARTGVGKTTFGLQLAINVARDGGAPLYFTFEQMDTDLMMKALGHVGRIPIRSLLIGDMADEEADRYIGASRVLCETALQIDSSSEGALQNVEMIASRAKRQGKLDLVVVDYLQLMTIPGERHVNRTEEVAKISRRLKKLAIKLKVPVLALAQINRRGAEEGEAPQPHHIKDSGAIEQDADVIMILHETEEGTVLNVAKNRRGEKGEIAMTCDLSVSRFSEAQG